MMTIAARDAVIVAFGRTAMGRSKNGQFRNVRAEDMSAELINGLFEKHRKLDPVAVDELIWGCANQTAEQGANLARQVTILSRLPNTVPAHTVNRLCGSSMTALHAATNAIMAGTGDMYVVGGVEQIGHVPMYGSLDLDPRIARHAARASMNMGLTAEFCGRKRNISRKQQDEFGLRSHQRAHAATESGQFNDEIIAIDGHDADGRLIRATRDEPIRPGTTLEELAGLNPVFDPVDGTITAGTSSQFSDGASVLVLMSAGKARSDGIEPLARIAGTGVAGTEPSMMGFGPVPSSAKALKRAGVSMRDIGAVEINEAFAAQTLACLVDMALAKTMDDKVNLFGGAIALGHPFGCSGARITGTLLNVMRTRGDRLGLATMCVGMGQGTATVLETL
jgi:acetyl-CoA acyltransferase